MFKDHFKFLSETSLLSSFVRRLAFVSSALSVLFAISACSPNPSSDSSQKKSEELWEEFNRKSELTTWQENSKKKIDCHFYYSKVFDKDINESELNCQFQYESDHQRVTSLVSDFRNFLTDLDARLTQGLPDEDQEMLTKLKELLTLRFNELLAIEQTMKAERRAFVEKIKTSIQSEGCLIDTAANEFLCLNYCTTAAKTLTLRQTYLSFLSDQAESLPNPPKDPNQAPFEEAVELDFLLKQMSVFVFQHVEPLNALRRDEKLDSKCAEIRFPLKVD